MSGALVKVSALLVWLLVGCNHLFYHPDALQRMTPDKVKLRYSEEWINSDGGGRLHAWHIKPEGRERRIVIVHFHGNAENMTTHFLYVAWLAKAGFDVITFDYRGYGRSEGAPNRAALVQDGRAALAWAAAAPSLKGKKIVAFGQSLGGAVAVPAVALGPPGLVSAVVVESTFDSYRHITRGKLASLWLTWPLQYPLSFLVSDELSPIDYVERLTQPLLVIHSSADPVVPMEFGQGLYAAAAMPDKEFWEVPSVVHTGAFADARSPHRARLVAYLCRVAGAIGCS